jgi:Cell division protein FtsI/penicillin-binding protein 2
MNKSKKAVANKSASGYNKEILGVVYTFVAIFILLIIYFLYFLIFESGKIINNSMNARLDNFAQWTIRGDILDRNKNVLVTTNVTDDNEQRVYNYGELFAHVVGYIEQGKTGIESEANFYLLSSNINPFDKLSNRLSGEKSQGDSVYTTLDLDLQRIAYEELGDRKGAVVVMEPDTGKILAMVSKPGFDPNELGMLWPNLISEDNKEANLLNRASQGLYPPGSIFKIITALTYIRQNPTSYNSYTFECHGTITDADGNTIRCYNNTSHGNIDLRGSFAKSCNTSFGNIGVNTNLDVLRQTGEDFLFNNELPLSFPYNQSRMPISSLDSNWDALQTAIGQGKTQVTPLHMAMLVSTIANGGILMNPYLIDNVEAVNGNEVKKFFPTSYGTLISANDAAILKDYMTAVVTEGTARPLQNANYQAAGKTGSAEFENGKESHAWFVGYAPNDNPQIAVSIIVEEGGVGSGVAVNIAKKLFDAYLVR